MIEQMAPQAPSAPDQPRRPIGSDRNVYCTDCGAPNAAENQFCVRCGRSLTPASTLDADPIDASTIPGAAKPTYNVPGAAHATYHAPGAAGPAYKACGCRTGIACAHDRLAGFGLRALALLIDAIVIGIVSGLLRGLDLRAVASLADAVYFVAFWSTTGQTLGMRALRIRVVRTDGQPLSWVTGVLRYVGYILSIIPLGLGLLWVLWDPRKQGWHDKIASTLVVNAD